MQTRLNEEIDLGAPAEIVPIGFRKNNLNPKNPV